MKIIYNILTIVRIVITTIELIFILLTLSALVFFNFVEKLSYSVKTNAEIPIEVNNLHKTVAILCEFILNTILFI